MMRETGAAEPVVVELSHSSEAYRTKYYFPYGYLWAHPAVAWGALKEAMPWEAVGVSVVVSSVAWLLLGSDLGFAMGLSITLALVALQMLRTRAYVTPARIVRRRGLFPFERTTALPLSAIVDGRVEYPAPGTNSIGDVVLATATGEQRLRAIRNPELVLKELINLKTLGASRPSGA
jgi:hypothetical protein